MRSRVVKEYFWVVEVLVSDRNLDIVGDKIWYRSL